MIDIWSALDFWQRVGVFLAFTLIPMGIYLHIDSYGGWALYLANKRRKKEAGRK